MKRDRLTALTRTLAERNIRNVALTVTVPVSLLGITDTRFTVGLVIPDQAAQSLGLVRVLIMLCRECASPPPPVSLLDIPVPVPNCPHPGAIPYGSESPAHS